MLGTAVVATDATIAADDNYSVIFVDTSLAAGNITITLPDASSTLVNKSGGTHAITGRVIKIMDTGGSASTKNIILTPAVGNIIGESSITLDQNYTSICVISNGTNWFLF